MKLTVVTDQKGELIALVHAHLSEHNSNRSYQDRPHATLRPAPDRKFHEIEVPDEYEKLPVEDLHRRVLDQIRN